MTSEQENRTIADIKRFFTGRYKESFLEDDGKIVYQRRRFFNDSKRKLTVLKNINTRNSLILGSTYDFEIPGEKTYEFFGYSALLLRNMRGTRLHILEPTQQMHVTGEDTATIFNLNFTPLEFLGNSRKIEEPSAIISLPFVFIEYWQACGTSAVLFRIRTSKQSPLETIAVEETGLGESLYENLKPLNPFMDYKKEFARYGIELVFNKEK